MTSEGEGAIELASRRLERAITLLEQRLAARFAETAADAAFDEDRSKLAVALDESRARERDLQEAGAAASAALGRAIEDIRVILAERQER